MSYKTQLEENGWILIKNVFTKQEVEQLRSEAYDSQKIEHKGDLLSNPKLGHIVYNDRILKILNDVLGDTPVYFGDGGYSIGLLSQGFHKDNADRENPNAPDWQSKFTIVRVGIYLQDHANHSGGLVIGHKSHKHLDLKWGKKINVPSESGDVMVWYLTTTHSGAAVSMKLFKRVSLVDDYSNKLFNRLKLPTRIRKYLPFMLTKPEKERVTIFMSFGVNDQHLKRYIEYLKTRRYMILNWQNSNYKSSLLESIKNKPLKVIDMRPEVNSIDASTVPEQYIQPAF